MDFKNNYNQIVDSYYDKIITMINQQEKIDLVTYVPLKPKDIRENRFDRFGSLCLSESKNNGIIIKNILSCTRDYIQKDNNSKIRQENVKNVFELLESVDGKTIVVLDDLYTTGSTIKEIARLLYLANAKKVIAIMLAINQPLESNSIQYSKLLCSSCSCQMSLKINHKGNYLFFGCDDYQKHTNNNTGVRLVDGIKRLKIQNRIEIDDVVDLNDEY